jgi:bifunctional N-acetylglucosamine-1-phosphate-uridyltransferase/glucosamine-1-phosphate-acetyltransferase GlmU-like protein
MQIKQLRLEKSIIVIPENNELMKGITSDLKTVIQPIALGTGDAVKKATQQLKNFQV